MNQMREKLQAKQVQEPGHAACGGGLDNTVSISAEAEGKESSHVQRIAG